MRLELEAVTVRRAVFAAATGIADGQLSVAREELRSIIAADSRLAAVEIEIANPGEDCRIGDVFDVFEPRAKAGGGTDFPGVLGPIERAGNGRTTVARGAAVVVLNPLDDRFKMTIDMTGPGAGISPYGHTANVCILSQPAAGVAQPAYYRALKEAGLKASVYLGEAAWRAGGGSLETFDLNLAPHSPRVLTDGALPRVAYIYMIASQQKPTEADEPVLYGQNVRHLLPTVLHPNEVLDGAVVAPYWNFGAETYAIQNHPLILELYRRHGRDLTFAGAVATVAADTEVERRRSAMMAANLAREALGADAVVLTKYGGGIPESALMYTYDACEALGMKGALIVWAHGGDGRVESTLTFMSPRADAVVSCGIADDTIDLPPIARVIGSPTMGTALMEGRLAGLPTAGPLQLRYVAIGGVGNQIGGGRRSSQEF